MFCNTFYCPYAKYILKDIEAFCSLLSSADKSKKSSSGAVYNENHFLQSIVWIIFYLQTSRTPAYALQNYFIYTVFSSGRNLMFVVHIVMIEIYIFKSHLQKKILLSLDIYFILVSFYQLRFFEGYVAGMWETQILILNPFVLFMSY